MWTVSLVIQDGTASSFGGDPVSWVGQTRLSVRYDLDTGHRDRHAYLSYKNLAAGRRMTYYLEFTAIDRG
jgi:hypothetical protein